MLSRCPSVCDFAARTPCHGHVCYAPAGLADPANKPVEGWTSVQERLWTRPNFARATFLAAQMVPEAICHVQCYVGVPFPFNTMDLVAMPYYSDTPLVAATQAIFR